MTVSSDVRFVDTVVEVACDIGYEFPDHTDRRTAYCNYDQTWKGLPAKCEGKVGKEPATLCINQFIPDFFEMGLQEQ